MGTVLQARLSPVLPLKGSCTPSNRSGLCPAQYVCAHHGSARHSAFVLRHFVMLGEWLQPGPPKLHCHGNLCSGLILLGPPAHSRYCLLLMSLILHGVVSLHGPCWVVAAVTSPIFSRRIHSCFCYTGLPQFAVQLVWELWWFCLGTTVIICIKQWDCGARTRGQARVALTIGSFVLRGCCAGKMLKCCWHFGGGVRACLLSGKIGKKEREKRVTEWPRWNGIVRNSLFVFLRWGSGRAGW